LVHIVQALVSLNLGGSELVATELCEYAAAQGHRVTIVAADGPLGDRIRGCGAEHLNWPIGKKRLGTLRYISRLRRWMIQEQPDVLHVHSRLPAWICEMALRGLDPAIRPAYITSMHGHYSVSRYSAVMAGGDRVIAVSEHVRDYTLHNYPSTDPARIVTVHGGVSHQAFPYGYLPDPEWRARVCGEFPGLADKRWLCLPGRLSRYKGHTDFIELIANLVSDVPDIHGVVVGTAKPGSRYRDELEGLAEQYGVFDRITFTGARQDIRDWMAASEIAFSLCSDPPEAFGRTVPEALHLGVPVIGWDHGGVAETLAKLFPEGAVLPGDRSELLSRSRSFLANRPAVPENPAFGLRESMEKTLAVYQSVRLEKNQ
jgi:glycosyltransferase involved in cell wall biosynthesis